MSVQDLFWFIITDNDEYSMIHQLVINSESYYLSDFLTPTYDMRIKTIKEYYNENELNRINYLLNNISRLKQLHLVDPYMVNIYTDGYPFILTLQRLFQLQPDIKKYYYDKVYNGDKKKLVQVVKYMINKFIKDYNTIGKKLLEKRIN